MMTNRGQLWKRWALVVALCGVVGGALAQPKGPADVITGAREAREKKELADSSKRASPLPKNLDAAHAHAAAGMGAGRQDTGSYGAPVKSLPPGSIRVRVVNAHGGKVAKQKVSIGIMESDGNRRTVTGVTNAAGQYVFSGLAFGDKQAYRARVEVNGATVASQPFRLPMDRGYSVRLMQPQTTQDPSQVVLYVGAVSVELQEERLKIAQQLRLVNAGTAHFVFPEGGMKIALPEGFMAFQSQETMTDQQVSSNEDGVVIEGSLPPGEASTLLWGYDLPVSGTEMTIALNNPFTTFAYRVLADAAPGLQIKVDEMPPVQQVDNNGAHYWLTETTRKEEGGRFEKIVIRLSGIPGPGPSRWIAASLALLVLVLGVAMSGRSNSVEEEAKQGLQVRKSELLSQLADLSGDREREEIGPEYFDDEKSRLTDALAVVLWEEEQLRTRGASK